MISSAQHRFFLSTLTLVASLGIFPALAFGQTPASDAPFEPVQGRLRVGQVAEVVDNSGLTVRGKVLEISSSKLVLTGGTGTRSFTGEDVTVIRRAGPIWDGAIKGAIIGAAPWILFATNCNGCEGLWTGAASTAAMGAAIGVGIDALFGPRTVYRASPPSRTVRFVPTLSRERKGVRAAISF